jgi:cellulose synthase (UDP-forming)
MARAASGRTAPGQRRRRASQASPTTVIVQPPPTDNEKYSYINRGLPYLFISLSIGFLTVTLGQIFMEEHVAAALILVPFTALNAIYQLISLPVNFTGKSFDVVEHRARIKAWRPRRYPVVDIFLPICGEPAEVLDNTWTAVAALVNRYPGVAYAHVLDDGADQMAAMLAESFGFNYVVRPNRGYYRKAGNLRYAFEHTRGDVIMILDADFAPRSDFLAETLPYFDDPAIAILQTPQFFRTSAEQTWVERAGATIQEVFYRSIQVARDRFGAAICVGTCALYRRTALEPHGGPALIAYAEDVHTGLDVHKDGYRLKYIPVNLATGMCPDNVHAFVHQQCRWATGNMFTVILSRLWEVPMTVRARLSHVSGFFYYLSSALAVFTLPIAPIVLLIFSPRSIRLANLLLFGPSLFSGMIMYPLWHQSKYRLREILPLTLIRGWAHVLAIWDYVRGRAISWQPSGASVSRVQRLWWSLILWNGSISVAWVSLSVWRIGTTRSPQFLISMVTGLLNMIVTFRAIRSMTARGQAAEARQQRARLAARARRRRWRLHPVVVRVTTVVTVAAAIAGVGGVATARIVHEHAAQQAAVLEPVHQALPATPLSYLGVYEPDAPGSYSQVDQFADNVAGRQPNLVLDFNGWGEAFPASFARTALANGATVIIDLDPTTVSLASIADGGDDGFLVSYARSVLRFGHPVVISFAHEMNGSWYNWGYTHVPPQTWIQAYQHVVNVFRQVGAGNVTWMWTVNAATVGEGPIADWWPGASYVDWVGIDGYFYYPTDTFSSVFQSTIQTIRGLGSKPILISETAVGPLQARVTDIGNLFSGVQQQNLLGFVWFDAAQNDGQYHQNWRLDGITPAVAAFRQGVQSVFPAGSAASRSSPG